MKKIKKIKAWAIVNKDFEINVENNPGFYSADVFFTESQARHELKIRNPQFCGECGRKNKKTEVYIKVIPIFLTPRDNT